MNILELLKESLSQIIFFSFIPFIWWLITARKKENFFSWIGIKKVDGDYKKIFTCIFIFVFSCIISQVFLVPNLVPDNVTIQSSYAGKGISALIPILLFSMINTGLSEEIFFRGFLGKRLCSKFGFTAGNLIQGLLFGLLHGAMLFIVITPFKALIITLITGFGGWLLGYTAEKASGGSIIPSWLIHGIGNLILSMLQAFGMI
ncbi:MULTISPECIES: CPBP family intramembrane glutamic endopeptidase [Clostridia]|uniref:CPBP family intramembrane glutamic endopeptidase n=1 Tax=Clostridium sp. CCUG 7971 TaxID=2811414 RepID=UPI001ABB6E50|nr:CPBP family intramembrane glutamic endopeptidase [Clostridium sp. CCUG 7971]MBO3446131.1 CPBP family intramembrane metalloprotease [Clostridium sp. CCUG 7971]